MPSYKYRIKFLEQPDPGGEAFVAAKLCSQQVSCNTSMVSPSRVTERYNDCGEMPRISAKTGRENSRCPRLPNFVEFWLLSALHATVFSVQPVRCRSHASAAISVSLTSASSGHGTPAIFHLPHFRNFWKRNAISDTGQSGYLDEVGVLWIHSRHLQLVIAAHTWEVLAAGQGQSPRCEGTAKMTTRTLPLTQLSNDSASDAEHPPGNGAWFPNSGAHALPDARFSSTDPHSYPRE